MNARVSRALRKAGARESQQEGHTATQRRHLYRRMKDRWEKVPKKKRLGWRLAMLERANAPIDTQLAVARKLTDVIMKEGK